MSCFRVPAAVCNDIERECCNFWWGNEGDRKLMHWSSWKNLCAPKSKGGVGFRRLESFNRALLAKQAWRLIKFPNSLVARLLKGRYYRNGDMMDAIPPCNASFSWRSICWGGGLLRKGIRWRIGNGTGVRAFVDPWIPMEGGGGRGSGSEGDGVRVADFLRDDGGWNQQKLESSFLPHEVAAVLNIDRESRKEEDVRFWRYDEKGRYTVKSGYLLETGFYDGHDSTSSSETKRWWSHIWNINVPPKVRVFMWRATSNFIPTHENLKK
ncbi:uncharacterized mitochondrial protein AtMg00310-like [Salvia miltiorrhiza]|uniref:uncharacterized mitochondrial protein AtMg00310-like n=1 Tax=Salvia miltiorrhiza TaxID=226208 RepID=UPI0025AC4194|nr:uncharacterized mitochondrial protein AtMg00310-like [Salvia miltiorrhiza]